MIRNNTELIKLDNLKKLEYQITIFLNFINNNSNFDYILEKEISRTSEFEKLKSELADKSWS